MDVEFAQLSDRGKVREGNEDYLGYVQPASPAEVRTRGWLFVLADGVGGHDFGEVASHTAVESVLERALAAATARLTELPGLPGLPGSARIRYRPLTPGPTGARRNDIKEGTAVG